MDFMKKIEMDEMNAQNIIIPQTEIGTSHVLCDVQVPMSANRDSCYNDESESFSNVDADETEYLANTNN